MAVDCGESLVFSNRAKSENMKTFSVMFSSDYIIADNMWDMFIHMLDTALNFNVI